MADWKIYYDDGFCLDGDDSTVIPKDRRFGVLVIVYRDKDHVWELCHSGDFYVRRFDVIQGHSVFLPVDRLGLIDYVVNDLSCIQTVLVGKMVPYHQFMRAMEWAQREMVPAKTGWHPGEPG